MSSTGLGNSINQPDRGYSGWFKALPLSLDGVAPEIGCLRVLC